MLHLPGRVDNDRGCGQLDWRLTSPGSQQEATPRETCTIARGVASCMFFLESDFLRSIYNCMSLVACRSKFQRKYRGGVAMTV